MQIYLVNWIAIQERNMELRHQETLYLEIKQEDQMPFAF